MIKRYGMSRALGPRTFGKREEMVFLGREISEERDYGDKVAEEIDEEVKSLINRAYEQANEILVTHKPQAGAAGRVSHRTRNSVRRGAEPPLQRRPARQRAGRDAGPSPRARRLTPRRAPQPNIQPQPAPTLSSSTDTEA